MAAKLNRTERSVRAFITRATCTPEQRRKQQDAENAWRRQYRRDYIRTGYSKEENVRASERPSHDLLRERDRRLSLPCRDLTSAFFGDPPVGLSALDRNPIQKPRITLAWGVPV